MKTILLRYCFLLVATQGLFLGACMRKENLNQRASSSKDLNSGDASSTALATDGGCADYFSTGKDASLEVSDISGQPHPLCAVLSESRAQYLIVVPAFNDCESCEKYAMELTAQSTEAGYDGAVKIALLLSNQEAALNLSSNAQWNFSDTLIFVDGKSSVSERLSKLGFVSGDEKLYALNQTSGSMLSYASQPSFADLTKILGIKKSDENDSSADINVLVNWDGLTNFSEGGWVINEIER